MEMLLSLENNINKMKRYFFCFLLIIFVHTKVHSQSFCTTFGEIRESIASCRVDTTLQLTYKKYPHFDFFNFEPITGVVNGNDFVEVGYDKRGNIREVVQYITMNQPRQFKFKVFDFEKYRIALLQRDIESINAFFFLRSVFILPKFNRNNIKRNNIYMVTFDPVDLTHRSIGLPKTWDTSPDRFKNFTTVSVLDHNLFTKVEYMLSDARVFLRNEYTYHQNGSGKIEMKSSQIFLPTVENSKLKFDDSICFDDIESVDGVSNWEEIIYPRIDKKIESLPLCLSNPFEFRE
ncbi:MAG TPA: hypothetical protein VIM65_01325 [Cyclobacteriaceae bacterium]